MVEFGEKLRQLRKEKNQTQKQLADLVGLKNSVPSPEVIKKMAAVLHVSADYLLGLERAETVDLHGLDDADKKLVRALVDTLRSKNTR